VCWRIYVSTLTTWPGLNSLRVVLCCKLCVVAAAFEFFFTLEVLKWNVERGGTSLISLCVSLCAAVCVLSSLTVFLSLFISFFFRRRIAEKDFFVAEVQGTRLCVSSEDASDLFKGLVLCVYIVVCHLGETLCLSLSLSLRGEEEEKKNVHSRED